MDLSDGCNVLIHLPRIPIIQDLLFPKHTLYIFPHTFIAPKLFPNVLQLFALLAPPNNFLRQVHILLHKLALMLGIPYHTKLSFLHVVPQVRPGTGVWNIPSCLNFECAKRKKKETRRGCNLSQP